MRTVDVDGLAIGPAHPPRIMAVLNVSPESPYDPSVHTDIDSAATQIEAYVDAGADIIDVGLASANKRFDVIDADTELERLEFATELLASCPDDPIYSLETRYNEVAAAGLRDGFDMINDICGFADPAMPEVCTDYDAAVVKMASPPDLARPGALESVEAVHRALQREGFTEKTIIDPAFGGWSEEKTLEDDWELFDRLAEFRAYGRPILVSINRKNFLRNLVGRSTEEALPVSLAATALAVERGVSVLRTHDVQATNDAAIIGSELGQTPVVRDASSKIFEIDTKPRLATRRQFHAFGVDPGRADQWCWRAFAVDVEYDELYAAVDGYDVDVYPGTFPLIVGHVRSLSLLDQDLEDVSSTVSAALEEIATIVRTGEP